MPKYRLLKPKFHVTKYYAYVPSLGCDEVAHILNVLVLDCNGLHSFSLKSSNDVGISTSK